MGMVLVESVTVGSGAAASIEFTGIPQTGVDLLLKFSIRDSAVVLNLKVNSSDSTAFKSLYYSPGSQSGTAIYPYVVPSSFTANTFGNGEFYFPNYTSSANKSASGDVVTENNNSTYYSAIYAAQFGSSAISSIQLVSAGTGFVQHSTASLYIITKA
jgi:hypothetical protein